MCVTLLHTHIMHNYSSVCNPITAGYISVSLGYELSEMSWACNCTFLYCTETCIGLRKVSIHTRRYYSITAWVVRCMVRRNLASHT